MQLDFTARDLERFWSRVICQAAPPRCWLWRGAINSRGYGSFCWYPEPHGQRWIGAHRASYILANGDIPDDLVVRHCCDVRICVRPEHLLIGTYAQNTADMLERGRHWRQREARWEPTGPLPWRPRGYVQRDCERCGKGFKVRRDRVDAGMGRFCSTTCSNRTNREAAIVPRDMRSCEVCGRRFERPPSAVGPGRFCNRACMGQHYARAGVQPPSMTAKLSPSDVRLVRYFGALRVPHREIARRFGVARSTISRIVNRTYYPDL
jgi:HNH endonuclease